MIVRNSFGVSLLATVCLTPLFALAANAQDADTPVQYDNQIGIFIQGVTGTNTNQYGRYNGFTTKGVDVLAEFDLHGSQKWDSGETRYWEFSGSGLNFQSGYKLTNGFEDHSYTNGTNNNWGPDASIEFRIGDQGSWGIDAYYNAISYTGNIIQSLYTLNGNTYTMNNGLLPWGGAPTTQTAAGSVTSFTVSSLSPYMKSLQTGTRRDILGGEGKLISGDWTIKAGIRHEHKEGTMEESLRETYSGEAFQMPVDYDTDRYELSASYNVPEVQALVQYTFSRFTDNNTAANLPYPVSATAAPYAQTGAYALPPSSDAHYLTLLLGYNPTPTTRINLNVRGGLELQNAPFAPTTATPNISAANFVGFANLNSHLEGTTGTSLNASANTYQVNFSASTSLFDNVDGRLFASLDGRDVSVGEYQVWYNNHSTDSAADTLRYVVPQDWTKSKLGGEISYLILPQSDTKLSVGYQYDNIDRTNAQVRHSDSNTASIDLVSKLGADAIARLSYEYSSRSGALNYATPWGTLHGDSGASGALSGAYYQAPMDSQAVKFRVDYSPSGEFSGGLRLEYRDERFHYPALAPGLNLVNRIEGIKADHNLTVGPDINYRPSDGLNFHVFYTYEEIFYDNIGNGACANSNTGLCLGSAGYFKNDYTSDVNTAGGDVEWKASEKLKLDADYTYSQGSVAFTQYNGVFVSTVTQQYQNVSNYPDINSTLHSLKLNARYELSSCLELSAAYMFDMFKSNDWNDVPPAVQPTTAGGNTISILTPGYASPNYNVSTFMAGFKVKF